MSPAQRQAAAACAGGPVGFGLWISFLQEGSLQQSLTVYPASPRLPWFGFRPLCGSSPPLPGTAPFSSTHYTAQVACPFA